MTEEKKSNYFLVYEAACRDFALHDPQEMAKKSGAQYDSARKEFTLLYLNREYLVSYPEGKITLKATGEDQLSDEDRIMVIHYLYQATKAPLTGKWVPYRELKGSGSYYGAFVRYGITPLAEFFGDKGDLFLRAGAKLGGQPYPYGDMGLQFAPLPNIPLALVIWEADEELDASANILFDYSATQEIHVEDLAALGPRLAWEMIRIGKELLA